MKKITLLLTFISLAFLATSCEHHHSKEEHHHENASLPSLNKGKKWEADQPTKQGFERLKANVAKFEKENSKDYANLANTLNLDIDAIFATCKMTGQAHEELHKYLALLLADITKMKGSERQVSEKSFHNLKENLEKFEIYFQY